MPRPAGIGVASSSFDDDEANLEAATTLLRFRFSGPLQPECIYDFDVSSGTLTPRKQDPANRWLDRNRYAVDRLCAVASDGEAVPISIVYRKDLRRLGGNPAFNMGYGADRAEHAARTLAPAAFEFARPRISPRHRSSEAWS